MVQRFDPHGLTAYCDFGNSDSLGGSLGMPPSYLGKYGVTTACADVSFLENFFRE